jgi:hypothetical protein
VGVLYFLEIRVPKITLVNVLISICLTLKNPYGLIGIGANIGKNQITSKCFAKNLLILGKNRSIIYMYVG